MKILHIITDTVMAGAQQVVLDLAEQALNDNNEVGVASMPGGPMWKFLDPRAKQFYLPDMVKPVSPKHDIKCLHQIKKLIKEFNPDIIQLHCSKAGILGRVAAGKKRKQVVYTVHGFDHIRVNNKKFLFVEKFFKSWCGAIVAVCDYDVKVMAREGITKNVKLVYNGVQKKSPCASEDVPAAITKAQSEHKKIVLSIARIAYPKRPDVFCETAKLIREKYHRDDIEFMWIGSCTDNSIKEQYEKYSSQGYVQFLGEINNASRFIPYCTLFSLFTDNEGLPMTLVESIACGKAMIASDVCGNTEVTKDNGILVNMFDIKGQILPAEMIAVDAAEKIISIIDDDAQLKALGQNGIKKYEELFTISSMWKGYKEIYQDLCRK